eukprot:UN00878
MQLKQQRQNKKAPTNAAKRNLTTKRKVKKVVKKTVKQQKRTNYSFVNVTGPKDTRYLDADEEYIPPKAKIFDNTLVYSSMILERPPICLPIAPKWEVDWYMYRQSKLSENAWVLPKDLEDKMWGKHQLDKEDWPTPVPHITKEDKANNRKSLYRKLDEPLYLICKVQQDFNKNLPDEIWMFPTTEVREGETVRSAAERTLFYHAGDLTHYTLGNAPIIYHDNELSAIMKKDYPDAKKCKNFYMHAVYLGGGAVQLEPDGEITDFAWVTQGELSEYFTSKHTEDLLKLTGSSLYYLRPE